MVSCEYAVHCNGIDGSIVEPDNADRNANHIIIVPVEVLPGPNPNSRANRQNAAPKDDVNLRPEPKCDFLRACFPVLVKIVHVLSEKSVDFADVSSLR